MICYSYFRWDGFQDLSPFHEDDLMAEPFEMKDGFYTVPTKPGLGVSLDEAAIDKYRVG